MSIGIDGMRNHPEAKINCPVCNGGGILDDGDNYGSCFVTCPCTGQSPPNIVEKVLKSYPEMVTFLRK